MQTCGISKTSCSVLKRQMVIAYSSVYSLITTSILDLDWLLCSQIEFIKLKHCFRIATQPFHFAKRAPSEDKKWANCQNKRKLIVLRVFVFTRPVDKTQII